MAWRGILKKILPQMRTQWPIPGPGGRSWLSGSGFWSGADSWVDLEDELVVANRAFAFASESYGFEGFPIG
jgi:hypothetical protein